MNDARGRCSDPRTQGIRARRDRLGAAIHSRALRSIACLVAAHLAVACDGPPPPRDATRADHGPPTITELTLSASSLTDDDAIQVIAVVSDPDGIADVVFGQIETQSGERYTAFDRVEGGLFDASLDWEVLAAIQPIGFETEEVRPLQAAFLDQAGNWGVRAFALTLTCGGGAACMNACADADAGPCP